MRSVICVLALLLTTVCALRADAATFTVTKAADTSDGICDSDCSLREAVAAANATPASDEIEFAVSTEIELTQGEIVITGPLSITGRGPGNTTLSGGGRSRIFYVTGLLSLSGLSLRRGTGAGTQFDGNGGAIASWGSLDVESCDFTENNGTLGGSIYTFLSSVTTVSNSRFFNNAAQDGGAIMSNAGNMTVRGSEFVNNFARGGGGAVYSTTLPLLIESSTFSGNSAATGGAVASVSGITIRSSTLSQNIARVSDGGAIFVQTGDSNLIGSRVSSNTAAGFGGGMQAFRAVIRDSSIKANVATGVGGGLGTVSGGRYTIENSAIVGNTADSGGGIWAPQVIVSNSSLEGNVAIDVGGGLFGGGTFTNSTISGNRASSDGGGIRGSATLTSVTIVNNQAASGAGVFGSVTARNSIFANNSTYISTQEDVWGNLNSQGYNLIKSTLNTVFSGDTATNITGVDPMLQAFTTTDGPTYYLPGPNSPAIDRGTSAGLTTDQRFRIRPVDMASISNAAGGDGADIGAVERQVLEGNASISGRVLTPTGQGLRNASVTLINGAGARQTVATSSFGTYTFSDVPAGAVYTVVATSKRYRFTPRTLSMSGDVANIDLTGLE